MAAALKNLVRLTLLASSLVGALSLGGCKQGEGEVCQINDDCESGLECNAGTRRCQMPGTITAVDAAPPAVDAATDEDASAAR